MSTSPRVLIIDDAEENVIYMSQILQDHGYEYAVARDGAEAMTMMESEIPKLVLLDLMMPRKTGFVVYRRMKEDPKLDKVPIVVVTGASVVTGVSMETGEEAPKDYGGAADDAVMRRMGGLIREKLQNIAPDGFIEKPIHPPTLVSTIKELLP